MSVRIKPQRQREAALRQLAAGLGVKGARTRPVEDVLGAVTASIQAYRRRARQAARSRI